MENKLSAAAIGVATFAGDSVLDVFFPTPQLAQKPAATEISEPNNASEFVTKRVVTVSIEDLSATPTDALDVYLRLHLLSHRLVTPHSINLAGIFGLLANVAWTTNGPIPVEHASTFLQQQRTSGTASTILGVDRFPRMIDYVVPSGVRIADGDRVRLGAYLAEGTVVMHEGFVNFNAGTLGKSMVEGRISAGVTVGAGSDIGGGASIMGTLSGGGKEVIRIGENCLVGANAGVGISLGNNCIIEAGLYLTAGSKVLLPDGKIVKATALSGESDLLYRRNSQTGAIEAIAKSGNWSGLNQSLH
ncbi:MAG: 2,3,4,5-tetrahydropyridine-2,6-dicarboxylate N-succinyltransferase [Actinobacteria bacterium]|nr:2,3,4,5-tetrahydropyridine-2,6-dicarboxylate N-succinyltransferase [Actinomycetota bacterium]